MKNISFISKSQNRLISISLLLLLAAGACNQSIKNSPLEKQATYLPPVTVLTDTCPPPETMDLKSAQFGEAITIIKSPKGQFELHSSNGNKITNLNTPTINKAESPTANFTNFNTEDGLVLSTIHCGLCDKNGNLWFGSEGGGISCYNGKRFTNYTVAEGLIDNNVKGIVEDDNGNIWIGTDAGLSRYDGQSFTNYGAEQGYIFAPIRSMIKDKSGKLWFGTLGSGVISFDPATLETEGKGFTRLTFPVGIQSNVIRAIIEDKNGNLWFGGVNGIIRYNPSIDETSTERFTTYTTEQGLAENELRSMFGDG